MDSTGLAIVIIIIIRDQGSTTASEPNNGGALNLLGKENNICRKSSGTGTDISFGFLVGLAGSGVGRPRTQKMIIVFPQLAALVAAAAFSEILTGLLSPSLLCKCNAVTQMLHSMSTTRSPTPLPLRAMAFADSEHEMIQAKQRRGVCLRRLRPPLLELGTGSSAVLRAG